MYKAGGIIPPSIILTIEHEFVGGNNPRTETEELTGAKGTSYKIKNRSNKSYKLDETQTSLLNGIFENDMVIKLTYYEVVSGATGEGG